MIITAQAPVRISLFGGGSDIDPFASLYGGKVLNFTIDKYQRVMLFTDEDKKKRNTYPSGADPLLLESILQEFTEGDISISSHSDVEIGAGLGSSAAAAVALFKALSHIWKERSYLSSQWTRSNIAQKAWEAEQKIGWYGGRQDQYASSYGGMNLWSFGKKVVAESVDEENAEALIPHMSLFYIGERKKKHLQDSFQDLTYQKIESLKKLADLAITAQYLIQKRDFKEIGQMLDWAWEQKKISNPLVSNFYIEKIYALALSKGAWGGKVLGAGSGGYMLFIGDPNQRHIFIKEMEKEGIKHLDFNIDWEGAKIL